MCKITILSLFCSSNALSMGSVFCLYSSSLFLYASTLSSILPLLLPKFLPNSTSEQSINTQGGFKPV